MTKKKIIKIMLNIIYEVMSLLFVILVGLFVVHHVWEMVLFFIVYIGFFILRMKEDLE